MERLPGLALRGTEKSVNRIDRPHSQHTTMSLVARRLAWLLCLGALVAGCSGTSSFGQATPITPAPGSVPPDGGQGSRVPSVIGSLSREGEALLEESRRQRRAGNFSAAEASVKRAMRSDPDHPTPWLELGQLRFEQGDYAEAEEMGNRSMSLAPQGSVAQSQAAQLIADAERARKRL